jgi:hypothetical protein
MENSLFPCVHLLVLGVGALLCCSVVNLIWLHGCDGVMFVVFTTLLWNDYIGVQDGNGGGRRRRRELWNAEWNLVEQIHYMPQQITACVLYATRNVNLSSTLVVVIFHVLYAISVS